MLLNKGYSNFDCKYLKCIKYIRHVGTSLSQKLLPPFKPLNLSGYFTYYQV